MFWSETEHREKIVSETISELLEVFVQQAKDLGHATSWNDGSRLTGTCMQMPCENQREGSDGGSCVRRARRAVR